jgi:hypothetical protein
MKNTFSQIELEFQHATYTPMNFKHRGTGIPLHLDGDVISVALPHVNGWADYDMEVVPVGSESRGGHGEGSMYTQYALYSPEFPYTVALRKGQYVLCRDPSRLTIDTDSFGWKDFRKPQKEFLEHISHKANHEMGTASGFNFASIFGYLMNINDTFSIDMLDAIEMHVNEKGHRGYMVHCSHQLVGDMSPIWIPVGLDSKPYADPRGSVDIKCDIKVINGVRFHHFLHMDVEQETDAHVVRWEFDMYDKNDSEEIFLPSSYWQLAQEVRLP